MTSFDPAESATRIVEPLRETCDESEAGRLLSPRAVALLREAELTKIVSPAAFGGYEMSPRALVEAERVVAHGSSAASWVLMVTGAHTFIAGRLPHAGLAAVFGDDPGMLIPGVPSLRPGTSRRVDGGYVLNGRWPYASGADYGDWVIVGSTGVEDDDGVSCPHLLSFVPKSDVTIDDTWFTMGMRGTGSKDIVAEDVFVPEHLALAAGRAVVGLTPGVEVPLYRLPVQATLATFLLGTIVGMAERALELVIDQAKTRTDAYTGDAKVHSAGMQRRVAEAYGEITAAWALTQQACDLLEDAMEHEPPMPATARAEVRWRAAYANELCLRATNRLFTAAGAGAAHDRNVLQRLFRDINTATHHAMLDFDSTAELQGQSMLGLELEGGRA